MILCLAAIAWLVVGCRTVDLMRSVATGPTRVPPTRAAQAPTRKPTRSPDSPYDFVTVGTPHCAAGDNAASVVDGKITLDGAPVVGQKVQASSGPGAEPISDNPAVSDEQGKYEVTFVCDNKACNGAFWVWLINDDNEQTSPFVQFVFDNQCRRGTINFSNP